GYDRDLYDFNHVEKEISIDLTCDKLELNYFGSIEHPGRVPHSLIEFLRLTDKNIIVNFYGSCSLIEKIIGSDKELARKIHLHGMVSYLEAVNLMSCSNINVVAELVDSDNSSSPGLIPTKVYEYLAALKPILAIINPNSDMAELLNNSGLLIHELSRNVDFEEVLDDEYLSKIKLNPNVEFINSLSRQSVADDLLTIIERC
ncbi:hypothetical protein L4D21_05295, partial [Photobacterium profundum]|uniref:hypothetical protein n=1 Tax=Photobacterium profundum TaxID=74109 RepID=UPI003D09E6C4